VAQNVVQQYFSAVFMKTSIQVSIYVTRTRLSNETIKAAMSLKSWNRTTFTAFDEDLEED
jgi:hypothetical protein